MANTIRAGRITGDPTAGLCERVCVEVPRVFDGCRASFNNQNFTLELTGIPAQATPPFTFVRAVNYDATTFENVQIDPRENCCACISGEIVLPVLVTFTDTYGTAYTATSVIRLHRRAELRLPEPSVTPYRVEVFAAFVSELGSFTGPTSVSVNGCYTYVIKIIVPTDLLVPTYGACVYPACTDCDDDICNALFSLPLFP